LRAKVAGAVTTLVGVATILVTVNSLFVLPAIAGQGAAVAGLAGGALAASASTSLALALATNP
jgi:hypothetical protein